MSWDDKNWIEVKKSDTFTEWYNPEANARIILDYKPQNNNYEVYIFKDSKYHLWVITDYYSEAMSMVNEYKKRFQSTSDLSIMNDYENELGKLKEITNKRKRILNDKDYFNDDNLDIREFEIIKTIKKLAKQINIPEEQIDFDIKIALKGGKVKLATSDFNTKYSTRFERKKKRSSNPKLKRKTIKKITKKCTCK
jgi:hypothetical protein